MADRAEDAMTPVTAAADPTPQAPQSQKSAFGSMSGGVTVACCGITKDVEVRPCYDRMLMCSKNQDSKTILENVNLIVKPGQVAAVMGPSGSGKTTLLNIIAGRSSFGRLRGEVLFNGRKQSPKQIMGFSNYVMAHDKLHAFLTVEETLKVACQLKLPEVRRPERLARVDQIIRDMGLTACRKTYVGGEWKKGISTGEMKRLSIAIELFDDPHLLLLDEPTSGLDSSLALEVMEVIVNVARGGRTILLTIHQPRQQVFALLDVVSLLNKGRVVYQGKPQDVRPHFASLGHPCPEDWNPADFLLDLISDKGYTEVVTMPKDVDVDGETESEKKAFPVSVIAPTRLALPPGEADALPDKWAETETQKKINAEIEAQKESPGDIPAPAHHRPSKCRRWPREFTALYKRSVLNTVRNPVAFCVAFVVQVLQGMILGGVFWKSTGPAKDVVVPETPAFLNSEWAQMYIYGVDHNGTRPLVEMVENGVDGEGSEPLMELFKNFGEQSEEIFANVMECFFNAYGMDQKDPPYPNSDFPAPDPTLRRLLSLDDTMSVRKGLENLRKDLAATIDNHYKAAELTSACCKPSLQNFCEKESDMLPNLGEKYLALDPEFERRVMELLASAPGGLLEGATNEFSSAGRALQETPHSGRPQRFMGALVKVFQLIDWLLLHTDYERAAVCLADIDDSLAFYLCIMSHADYLLNPLLTCIGLPELPGFKQPDPISVNPTRRLLSTYFQTSMFPGPNEGMIRGLEPSIGGLLDATVSIINRISNCNSTICTSLASIIDGAMDFVMGSLTSLTTLLSVAGCLYFVVANLGFASFDSLLTFPQERAIFNHEAANGLYSVSAYFVAKNLADLPFQLIPPVTLCIVYNLMVDLSTSAGQFFRFLGIGAALVFSSYGFAYLVSAASPRLEISVMAAPFIFVIFLVLAGFFLRDEQIPVWIAWFRYFSISRWSFFAFVLNQFPDGSYFGTLPAASCRAVCGVEDTRLWFQVVMLLVLGVGYRIVAYFLLRFTNRKVGLER